MSCAIPVGEDTSFTVTWRWFHVPTHKRRSMFTGWLGLRPVSWGDAAGKPFPFVVGCDRSGTTLLRAMLATHPDLAIPDESYFIVGLARRRRGYERQARFDVGGFLRDLYHDPSFQRWTIPHEHLAQALRADPPADLAEAVRTVFAVYAHARGKSRYGDKTPVYVMHLDALARLFPEAVFIHIIRDGRDVALSLVERSFALPRDVGQAALLWRERVQAGGRVGATLGRRYLEIRYEDLVTDPGPVLAAVCAHAALRFDAVVLDEMLGYPEQAPALLEDAADPSAHTNVRRAVTTGLRDWRAQMPIRDQLLMEAIAGDTLRSLGYPPSATLDGSAVSLQARRASAGVRWCARKRMLRCLIWCNTTTAAAQRLAARVVPAVIRQDA
jgi:sulfotransferase family protein